MSPRPAHEPVSRLRAREAETLPDTDASSTPRRFAPQGTGRGLHLSRMLTLAGGAWSWGVAVAGLGATAVLVFAAHALETSRARRAFEKDARTTALALRSGVTLATEIGRTLSSFFDATPAPTDVAFQRFTDPLLRRHPTITLLEWAPRVAGADRKAFETEQRRVLPEFVIREPDTEGRFVASPARGEYFPLRYVAPPSPMAFGLDIGWEPVRRSALEAAIANGNAMGSARFTLAEDPPSVGSVVVYVPVYVPGADVSTSEARHAALRGIAIEVFRIQPMVDRALEGLPDAAPPLVLVDDDAPRELRVLYESERGLTARMDRALFHTQESFPFVNRRWTVHMLSPVSTVPFGAGSWGALFTGLALTGAAVGAARGRGRLRTLERAVQDARQYGQYHLVRKIGEGGMGTVYEARHALLRRPTALKLVTGEGNRELLARFEREVRLMSRLTHPNTVSVYDYGHTPEGVFYYAMEYLEGLNLEELVAKDGPQPPARVVHIVRQILGSLAEAHEAGLVHRDVKPSNVMLCVRGGLHDVVKVLDFGLVKETSDTSTQLSIAGQVLGTPEYMAPEALTDPGSVGAATDLYGVGAVAYFLLTGGPVFEGASVAELVVKQMTAVPVPPSRRATTGVPDALERSILWCLEKAPDARPGSARALARALEALDAAWTEDDAKAWWARHADVLARSRTMPPEEERVSAVGPTVAVQAEPVMNAANGRRA